ncbi:polyphosphate kinase 2 [Hyphomicrobium facile]|uniref:ADP/GDP-polyphosphate phosphotransferase n=1 Tax=Hyphomicrobium facile TaxID=51670 RepID=A0A1I7MTH0_9HYPH|nr:polyphosphate kinase 2 [Hyphomicrobium facile]SFV25697.1 polyphosphate kinase 2, PA0141 family [Hyphomicrobium facile]
MGKNKHKDKKPGEPDEFEPLSDEAATVGSRHNGPEPSNGEKSADRHDTTLPKGYSLDPPVLPKEIADAAMRSGGYPYDTRLKATEYEEQLLALQIELMKLQKYNLKTGNRILCLYEGRDGSGKSSCIKAFDEYMNPRNTRTVALPKPTETERGQLYFQRYAEHLPSAGEIVLFDRSWYNRAGVERVMGYCTPDQLAVFLREAPQFEGLLVRDGIKLFKYYLTIGREMQLKRFYERAKNPLKQWKLSSVDLASLDKYDDYTHAEVEMFRFTSTATAPWTVVRANDQRRARLETIRHVLLSIEYEGRDLKAIGKHDPLIIGSGPEFFHPQVEKQS